MHVSNQISAVEFCFKSSLALVVSFVAVLVVFLLSLLLLLLLYYYLCIFKRSVLICKLSHLIYRDQSAI